MIQELKPFSSYQEPGLSWMGALPMHWETRPAFGAFKENHQGNKGMRERTVLSLSYGRIVVKPPEKLHGLVPESFETYQIVNPGDIVLRTTDLQNDHTSLRVAMVRDRGIITSAYLALNVKPGVLPEYGFQILNVWDQSKAIYGFGSGLRQNLDFSHFKRMPVPVPPPDEQAAIVRFLEWANARLERTIRAKRKVIALLNEQKQAIIHRAVTQGLDPKVPMKASGVPWVERVPKHWELQPNRALLKLRKRQVGDRSSQFVLLSLTLRGVIARDIESQKGKWPTSFDTYQVVDPGNLIFCLFDIDETPRFVGLSELAGMITGAYTVFECKDLGVARFIYLYYLAMDFDKRLKPSYTGLRKVIQKGTFLTFKTPIPPKDERQKIWEVVRAESAGIDSAVDRLRSEIGLLKEYQARLTADVVTGKVDVRKVAAALSASTEATVIIDSVDEGDDREGSIQE